MRNYVLANSGGAINSVSHLTLTPSDPPSADEVQAIIYKLNGLIAALKREPPS